MTGCRSHSTKQSHDGQRQTLRPASTISFSQLMQQRWQVHIARASKLVWFQLCGCTQPATGVLQALTIWWYLRQQVIRRPEESRPLAPSGRHSRLRLHLLHTH